MEVVRVAHKPHDFVKRLVHCQKVLLHYVLIVFPAVFHDFLVLAQGDKIELIENTETHLLLAIEQRILTPI